MKQLQDELAVLQTNFDAMVEVKTKLEFQVITTCHQWRDGKTHFRRNRFSEAIFVVFSRNAATLYERVSLRPSVRWSVGHAFVFRPTRSDECRVYGPFTCFFNLAHLHRT